MIRTATRGFTAICCMAAVACLAMAWVGCQFWSGRRTIAVCFVIGCLGVLVLTTWYSGRLWRWASATAHQISCQVLWLALRQFV